MRLFRCWPEMLFLGKCAEFTGGVHFLHFLTENILFLTNLVPKFIIAYCEISKMQNSMVMFTFYIFIAGSALFGEIWPKKNFSLSWNFILRLIRTWRIQWWCSLFLFLIRSILFPEKLVWKIKFICCSWNLEPRLFWIYNIR